MSFNTYSFSEKILSQITAQGFVTPTPIQQEAIPVALEGKDVLGLAQTGTGKTAAFVLPMLQRLLQGKRGTLRGLIVAPTRELAEQINSVVQALGKKTGLKSTTIYGGVSMNRQIQALRNGADIAVACPGRLLDHVRQRTITLSRIEILVLDEADQMFDMGFLPSIREIISLLPAQRQTMFFSATMPKDIRKLADQILKNPVRVEIDHDVPVTRISHVQYPVDSHLKTPLLIELLKRTRTQSVLIFTRTKYRAKTLEAKLKKSGFRAASLQGNLSQARRQAALDGFRSGKFDIIVATDIAARGTDVPTVSHVINFDMPDTPEAYTHRIGRTGRAERTGDAFSLVSREENGRLRDVERTLGSRIKACTLEGFDYKAAKTMEDAEPARPFGRSSYHKKPSSSARPKRHRSAGPKPEREAVASAPAPKMTGTRWSFFGKRKKATAAV